MVLASNNLKSSGIFDQRVWIGTWSLGGEMYGRSDARESLRLLNRAFDAGFFCYDTAGFYAHGLSESLLRQALGKRRREIFLCTKGGLEWQGRQAMHDATPEGLRRQLFASLKRLDTDYIDLYLLHWPSSATPLAESLAALLALQKEGWIHAYGVCNLTSSEVLQHLTPGGELFHQIPFNPLRMENAAILAAGHVDKRCRNCVISPFEQGLLSVSHSARGGAALGKRDIRRRNPRFHDPAALALAGRYRELAAGRDLSLSALVLKWLLERSDVDVIIPGPRTVLQLEELIALTHRLPSPAAEGEEREFMEFLGSC